jgi:hypothetical protein
LKVRRSVDVAELVALDVAVVVGVVFVGGLVAVDVAELLTVFQSQSEYAPL